MDRVVYGDNKFIILKTTRGAKQFFTVIRKNMPRQYHAHFDNIKGARIIVKLYWQGKVPKSAYLLQALKRLCTEKELLDRRITHT